MSDYSQPVTTCNITPTFIRTWLYLFKPVIIYSTAISSEYKHHDFLFPINTPRYKIFHTMQYPINPCSLRNHPESLQASTLRNQNKSPSSKNKPIALDLAIISRDNMSPVITNQHKTRHRTILIAHLPRQPRAAFRHPLAARRRQSRRPFVSMRH